MVLRLDPDVKERLDMISTRDNLSINHVVNTGLREYAEWGSVYQNIGLAAIGKKLLRKLFDNLSEETAREIGKQNGREEAPRLIISWFGTFDLPNVLEGFGNVLAKYSGAFVFEHSQENRIHTVVIRHDLGRHGSAYYSEYGRSVCSLLNMPCSVSETENQVVIKAEEPSRLADTVRGLPPGLIESPAQS